MFGFILGCLGCIQFPLDGDGGSLLGRGSQSLLQLREREPQQRLQVTDKPVDVALVGNFLDDVLVVVVAETATQFLVVHGGLALAFSPAPGDLWRVGDLELPVGLVGPLDAGLALPVREQLEEELPQLDLGPSAELHLRGGCRSWVGGGTDQQVQMEGEREGR